MYQERWNNFSATGRELMSHTSTIRLLAEFSSFAYLVIRLDCGHTSLCYSASQRKCLHFLQTKNVISLIYSLFLSADKFGTEIIIMQGHTMQQPVIYEKFVTGQLSHYIKSVYSVFCVRIIRKSTALSFECIIHSARQLGIERFAILPQNSIRKVLHRNFEQV